MKLDRLDSLSEETRFLAVDEGVDLPVARDEPLASPWVDAVLRERAQVCLDRGLYARHLRDEKEAARKRKTKNKQEARGGGAGTQKERKTMTTATASGTRDAAGRVWIACEISQRSNTRRSEDT